MYNNLGSTIFYFIKSKWIHYELYITLNTIFHSSHFSSLCKVHWCAPTIQTHAAGQTGVSKLSILCVNVCQHVWVLLLSDIPSWVSPALCPSLDRLQGHLSPILDKPLDDGQLDRCIQLCNALLHILKNKHAKRMEMTGIPSWAFPCFVT